MPQPPVVLNNTPLVALYLLEKLTLLRDLYGEVLIPEAVQREFLAIDTNSRQATLTASAWIKVTTLPNPKQILAFERLDEGEAAVLTLALEQDARLVIIDERRARQHAKRMGLPLTGTLGVLLLAKQEGLIASQKKTN